MAPPGGETSWRQNAKALPCKAADKRAAIITAFLQDKGGTFLMATRGISHVARDGKWKLAKSHFLRGEKKKVAGRVINRCVDCGSPPPPF